ncbi:putative kynureninase [Zalerion maritima]|uniref:Kynureninase n=1 Tax=Zalerion maritima TaxID=339359 RepID=A0AAD5RUG9_9PEZI|nr:putative kynureninase [Zalerion maritima]
MTSFTSDHLTLEGARALDSQEPLDLRSEFVIPTKADIASDCLLENDSPREDKCTYLCGNSLGLQPTLTRTRIQQYLTTWATQGVYGHFKPLSNSPLPTWLDVDDKASKMIAPIVGAQESEVAALETLTANLHLLMAAFYRPDAKGEGRHKIILESKAFPSDHFAVETQIRHHSLDPATSMVCIESLSGTSQNSSIISTYEICSIISKHAKTTCLLILPGIQYYTGQLFDIPAITAFAHKHGVFVIWDLAHAVGNVELKLHEWDVDAAVWCSYKYLNGGPGCIGGMFVHERNSKATYDSTGADVEGDEGGDGNERLPTPRRLGGWWGNSKKSRFAMATSPGFIPVDGAAGFQLSNPSVLDITSLCASLEVFEKAGGVKELRKKSLRLTGYLETALRGMDEEKRKMFRIITPDDPKQRGAQLSVLLLDGKEDEGGDGKLLEAVTKGLEKRGVIVDERRPNVIRVAPAPLYSSFEDVWLFVKAFGEALGEYNG